MIMPQGLDKVANSPYRSHMTPEDERLLQVLFSFLVPVKVAGSHFIIIYNSYAHCYITVNLDLDTNIVINEPLKADFCKP